MLFWQKLAHVHLIELSASFRKLPAHTPVTIFNKTNQVTFRNESDCAATGTADLVSNVPFLNFQFAENFAVTILERLGENFIAKYSLIFKVDCCEHCDWTKAERFSVCVRQSRKEKYPENGNQAINSTNSSTSSREKAMRPWEQNADWFPDEHRQPEFWKLKRKTWK